MQWRHIGLGLALVWVSLAPLAAQFVYPDSLRPDSLPITSTYIYLDNIGQLYTINPDRQLIKWTEEGSPAFVYSDNTLGAPSYVDITDPFHVLLFYADYQSVVQLDRTLNPVHQLNLFDLGYLSVPAVGLSAQNQLWLYDAIDNRLVNMDQQGKVINRSDPLPLLLGVAPRPHQLIAREQWVYLVDEQLGVLVFDQFGQYHQSLPIHTAQPLQWHKDKLFYQMMDADWWIYDLTTGDTQRIRGPWQPGAQLYWWPPYLYERREAQLLRWPWKVVGQ